MLPRCLPHLGRSLRTRNYATSTKQPDNKKSLGIIGVPFAKGQSKAGVEKAPQLLRERGLIPMLERAVQGQVAIRDYGDLQYKPENVPIDSPGLSQMKHYGEFLGCNKTLIGKVQQLLNENDQFLALGGDHAIGFGSVAGHLQHTPNLSLVWIDAHADINLQFTSSSGNIHGMPVSFLLKDLRTFWKHAHLDEIAPNCLETDQLTYIGLRDVDPYEAYILKRLGIRTFAMDAIDRLGILKVIEITLDAIKPQNKIHVSIDIDALDNIVAPSTGTVVAGGLTLRETLTVVEALRDTNRVQGVDLVELNPLLGSQQDVKTTVLSCMEILKSICGFKRSDDFSHIDTTIFKTNQS